MKKTANGNMYTVTLDNTWDSFEQNLEGARSGVFLVAYTNPLSETVMQAFQATAKSLGYGEPGATFASLRIEPAAQLNEALEAMAILGEASEDSTPEMLLDSVAIFSLVEGLDPLVIIAADSKAASLLGAAYKQDVVLERASQLFGRPLVAFADFATHLENPDAKQRAWRLLKTLPTYCGK